MLTLAVNTAFTRMEVALADGDRIIADAGETLPRGQETALPGLVAGLLGSCGLAFSDIRRLAVVTGPGSFTGLRIGVAYVRAIALVNEVPAIGVSSIEAAIPAGMQGVSLGALMARRRPPDQSWWVQAVSEDAGIAPVQEAGLELLQAMLEGFHAPVFMEGAEALGPLADRLDLRPMRPSAITAALKAALFDPLAHPPAPVYAREPDATLPAAPPAAPGTR